MIDGGGNSIKYFIAVHLENLRILFFYENLGLSQQKLHSQNDRPETAW